MMSSFPAEFCDLARSQPLLVRLPCDPNPGVRTVDNATSHDQHPAKLTDAPHPPAPTRRTVKKALLRFKRSILMKLSPVTGDRRIRVMQQRSVERPDRAIDADRLVNQAPVESAHSSAEESDVTGLFTASVMMKRATHKIRWAKNPISVKIRRAERILNLFGEVPCNHLVGVEA